MCVYMHACASVFLHNQVVFAFQLSLMLAYNMAVGQVGRKTVDLLESFQ